MRTSSSTVELLNQRVMLARNTETSFEFCNSQSLLGIRPSLNSQDFEVVCSRFRLLSAEVLDMCFLFDHYMWEIPRRLKPRQSRRQNNSSHLLETGRLFHYEQRNERHSVGNTNLHNLAAVSCHISLAWGQLFWSQTVWGNDTETNLRMSFDLSAVKFCVCKWTWAA